MAQLPEFDYPLDSINEFTNILEGPTEDLTTLGQPYTEDQQSSYADHGHYGYPGDAVHVKWRILMLCVKHFWQKGLHVGITYGVPSLFPRF